MFSLLWADIQSFLYYPLSDQLSVDLSGYSLDIIQYFIYLNCSLKIGIPVVLVLLRELPIDPPEFDTKSRNRMVGNRPDTPDLTFWPCKLHVANLTGEILEKIKKYYIIHNLQISGGIPRNVVQSHSLPNINQLHQWTHESFCI